MSGRILPFRLGPGRGAPAAGGARAGMAAQQGIGSGVRLPVSGEPAGAAAPFQPSRAPRFRELVLPHLGAAYSLARYLARDPVAAEDIAQDAMLRAFRGFETLRGEPKPWLLAIVRNAYFDWRRRARGWDAVAGPGGEAEEAALENAVDPEQESAETGLIRQGDLDALRAAIETIPEPFREALVLRDLEELSYRQVAEITGSPMGTVMSRLARARRMLGERLGVMEAAL
jgi:RNA polymerase sigma-70 factor (ECF subfamily)